MATVATTASTISGFVYFVISVWCAVVNNRWMQNVRLRIYIFEVIGFSMAYMTIKQVRLYNFMQSSWSKEKQCLSQVNKKWKWVQRTKSLPALCMHDRETLLHLCSPASDVYLHSDVQVVQEDSDWDQMIQNGRLGQGVKAIDWICWGRRDQALKTRTYSVLVVRWGLDSGGIVETLNTHNSL